MQIYTTAELSQLKSQSRLKDLYTNDYLNDINNDNFKIIAEMFFNKSNTRTKLFNVGSNLFNTVGNVIAYFVGNPYMSIPVQLQPYIADITSVGQAVFGLKRVDNGTTNGAVGIYYIPAENHIISDGISKVYTMYKSTKSGDVNYYILKQMFYNGRIENQLFLLDQMCETDGTLVPLDTIQETAKLQEVMETGLDVPAIVYTDVNKLDGIQSELDRIKNLVYSIDRKAVMFETQFLGEVEQYKIFENIQIPESAIRTDGTVDINKIGKIVATDSSMGATGDIKYVSNQNDLIQQAIEYEKTQIQKISSATTIPVEFLGINSTSAISAESRALMSGSFIKKIQYYRDLISKPLNYILQLFEGQQNINGETIGTSIIWGDIISKDDQELANELQIALQNGFISRETAVQKYLKLINKDDIQEELNKINIINTNNNED